MTVELHYKLHSNIGLAGLFSECSQYDLIVINIVSHHGE